MLADVRIPNEKLVQLQTNLIRSHACGVGPILDDASVRALLWLGCTHFCLPRRHLSWRMRTNCGMIEHDILPVIPCQGSVGASGDLAPLAHLALTLIGEGEVRVNGAQMPTAQAFKQFDLKPAQLGPKEGLSITNGTQFMAARAAINADIAQKLITAADFIAAMSLDAFRGTAVAF